MFPAFTVLLLMMALDAIPIAIAVPSILGRAREAGARAGWHVGAAIFGGLIAALAVQILTIQTVIAHQGLLLGVHIVVPVVVLFASGMLTAGVVACCSYLHLCMRTARDPDYEDRGGTSREADVHQPGDGDDLLPK